MDGEADVVSSYGRTESLDSLSVIQIHFPALPLPALLEVPLDQFCPQPCPVLSVQGILTQLCGRNLNWCLNKTSRHRRDGSAAGVLAALAEGQSWLLAFTPSSLQLLVSSRGCSALRLCVQPGTVHTATHKLLHINEINLFL